MTPATQSRQIGALCALAPVIPVLVIDDASRAPHLAQALVRGGLPVLEVTLRTPAALDAIAAMAHLPGAQVGAGTVITPEDARRAKEAGASFAVSPGLTDRLARACEAIGLPLLPGAVTASEVMAALERGYDMLKFFPAESAGGAGALASLGGPLPAARFCPTGGISPDNAAAYLRLPNVACVGGSWLAPASDIAAQDWAAIEGRARACAMLR